VIEPCVSPGLLDGPDFGIGRLACGSREKSGGDDHAAELDGHVGERGLGLGGVPGRLLAAVGGVGRVVAVQRVPDDGDRIAVQAERDGATRTVSMRPYR
jgi:hypothetical protein